MKVVENRVFLRVVLFLVFILGLLFYLNPYPSVFILNNRIIRTRNNLVTEESMTDRSPKCPNLLRQEGDMIMLYDLNAPGSNTNPAVFHHLAEYAQFVKEQQAEGIHCPVLELQTEIVGASISDAPTAQASGGKKEEYLAYDTYGEGNIGLFNKEDEVIDPNAISDNPMDPNWGGIQYSEQTLAAGKYDGDRVTKPLYYNMPQNAIEMNPTYRGENVAPPNYVPSDLVGKQIQHSRSS